MSSPHINRLTDPDDDPDIQLSIPIKPVFEELCCPICFNAITECIMTPCGHNFCSKCIFECINRKHVCPCCNHPTEKAQCVKNHHFDRLLTLVTEHKEAESKKYFERIINAKVQQNGANTTHSNNSDNTNNNQRQLSPIEVLFHKHMKKSLVNFEEYYRELEAQHKDTVTRLQSEYAKRMAIAPQAQTESIANECAVRTSESEREFEKASDLLMQAYDSYLSNVAPAPASLPVSVTLSIPSRKMRFDGIVLKPTDLVKDARARLERKMDESGVKLMAWSPGNVFILKRGTEEVILNDEYPISQYRPKPGSELAVVGEVHLMSDKPPECFTLIYNPSVANQTCDYYTCKDCKFNWICKTCADHCHKGHNISVYIMGHKATWACCYCTKNKCTIANAKSKKT